MSQLAASGGFRYLVSWWVRRTLPVLCGCHWLGPEWTSVYVKELGGLPGQAGAKQGTSPRSEEASGWCSLEGRRLWAEFRAVLLALQVG